MTMTTSHETVTDAARRGQEAFTGALQIWADSMQRFVPTADKVRGAVEVVDRMYDFADHMLASQREFTKSLLAVSSSAATKATSVAHDAAKDMQDVAKEAAPKKA